MRTPFRHWVRAAFLWLPTSAMAADREVLFASQHWQRTADLLFHAPAVWAFTLNLLAAATLFAVWRRQRDVSLFTWLFGASLTGNAWFMPMSQVGETSNLFAQTLLLGWFYCLFRILHPFPSPQMARVLRTVFPLALLVYGTGAVLSLAQFHEIATAAFCIALLMAASAQWWRKETNEPLSRGSLLVAVWLLALAGLVDEGVRFLDLHLPAYPDHYLALMPPAQMLAVALALHFLVSRHAENQQTLRQLHDSLEERVQAAEAELEIRYRAMTQDSLNAAAMRERSQIYESIHEDLSDKLLQLIYSAEKPETAELARSALGELRDSRRLHPEQSRRLSEVLADLRAESQARCDLAALNLHWSSAENLEAVALSARQESALSRTLREALSNLLKHARARNVRIDFERGDGSPGSVRYRVSDDGTGMQAQDHRGRGLSNMRQRLEELGGSVHIRSSHDGTCLHFEFPIRESGI